MKLIWLALLLFSGFWASFTEVAERNKWKSQANAAFRNGEYYEAARLYQLLLSGSDKNNPEIRLNLGNSLRLAGKNVQSIPVYQQVTKAEDRTLRSVGWQQLGNLAAQTKEYEKALKYYRNALIDNSKNETARYNYELITRLVDNKNEQPAPPEPQQEEKDQASADQVNKGSNENPDQSNSPTENGKDQELKQGSETGTEQGQKEEGSSESNQKPEDQPDNANPDSRNLQTLKKRLEAMNMTPEQAQTILDAMRDNELQYLQQLPKPSKNTPKKGVPNW